MPIPQDSPVPDVAPRPLGTPYDDNRVTPEEMGAGVGDALQQQGALASAIATKSKENADAAAVAANEAEGVRGITSILHDPKSGLLNLNGKQANDAFEPAKTKLQELFDGQIAKAANPDQKRALTVRYGLLANDADRKMQEHVGQQLNVMAAQANASRIDAGVDAAVNSWNDPPGYQQALFKMRPFAIAEARRQGLDTTRSPEAQAAGEDDSPSAQLWVNVQKKVALHIAQTMLDKNLGDKALQFLNSPLLPGGKTAQEILGAEASRGLIREARFQSEAGAALGSAMTIAAANRVPGTLLIDEEKAQAAYKEQNLGKVSPEQYERGAALLQQQVSQGASANQAANARAYNQLYSNWQKEGEVGFLHGEGSSAAIARLQEPNNPGGATLLAQLEHDKISAPPTPAQEISLGRARNAVAADDWKLWAQKGADDLVGAAQSGKFGVPLTRSQLDTLLAIQTASKQRLNSGENAGVPATVESQLADRLMKVLSFPAKKENWSEQQWGLFNHISGKVRENELAWIADPKNQGKRAGPDDYGKWIDGQLQKGDFTGSHWWNSKITRAQFEADPKYRGSTFLPAVAAAPSAVAPAAAAAPADDSALLARTREAPPGWAAAGDEYPSDGMADDAAPRRTLQSRIAAAAAIPGGTGAEDSEVADLPPDFVPPKTLRDRLSAAAAEGGHAPSPAAAPAAPSPSPARKQDKAALQWLKDNPDHPAAAGVRAKLKARGLI